MKYIEQIKTIILTFLVLLSLVLTFSIWSYTPNLQIIDETPVDQITVGTEKTLDDVIKPHRILFREGERFKGTITSIEIDTIMANISNWKASDIQFVQSNLTNIEINEFIKGDKRISLFYEAEVPLKIMTSMMIFSDNEVPGVSFDRLIIDWHHLSAEGKIIVYFLSSEGGTLYSTEIVMGESQFIQSIIESSQNLGAYQEIERKNALSLYVPENNFDIVKYTYYIDEISPDMFKDILFIDPSIVQRNIESAQSEKYIDGMSLMTVDTHSKVINYVYPASESIAEIPAAKLLKDSFDFVNEHGGFTGDYRYQNSNVVRHIIEYQLYLQGLPVFSNATLTKITTTWGENQIFRYRRPYYFLDMDISSEKYITELPSGVQIVDMIINSSQMSLSSVDEIYLGYYLSQSDNEKLFTLEPSWFAIINGNWTRLTPDFLGGVEYGLE